MEDGVTDVVGEWVNFLSRYCRRELAEIEREFPFRRSLYIDYRTLQASGRSGLRLADEVIERPGKATGDIRDALRQLTAIGEEKAGKINVRFHHIERVTGIRDIRAYHINRFVSLKGIIRKTTEVRPRIVEAVFQCPGCGSTTTVRQGYGNFEEPEECPNPECNRRKLKLLQAKSRYVDSQKVRIQESPEGLRGGARPQTLDVEVTDDLTGAIAPGDRVVLNGIPRSRQRVNYGTKSTLFDISLECSSIEAPEREFEEVNISEEDEAEIHELSHDAGLYGKITGSIAPSIYGNTEVKEAIALQLFGGVAKNLPDGSRLRGDIHVLLVGDPGIAKSQILRYVVQISPRGVYTSGKSSTSAGLTATAVKDDFGDGSWTLEAGALVLADMGLAAVDEMDKMQKEDRSALHEAMEQQCYDDQTEVLTEAGWKYFRDVTDTDRVATLSPEGYLEYQRPMTFVDAEYDGEMYFFTSRQVDLAVTPNHTMYVNLNHRANEWAGFARIRADELPIRRRMRFKKNAKWVGERQEVHTIPGVVKYGNQNCTGIQTGGIEIPMDDWLEFLGYFLSEGCVSKHWQTGVPYRIAIGQKKPESTETIRRCLERLPFRFTYDGANFVINSKQLACHMEQFGTSPGRHVPDYAKHLPLEQIQILLDALVLGDGSIDRKTGATSYITSSKRLADDVTELLLKVGLSGNRYLVREAGSITSNPRGGTSVISHDIYTVSFIRESQNEPNINTNGHQQIERGHYTGRIYCVEVPNHLLYVRRNGIPVWCGNSISVAKAGITATLRSRCALLGAANPKLGRFDAFVPIAEQINMPPSLLSRFDLIFVLTDKPDHTRDTAIARHIISAHRVGELIMQKQEGPLTPADADLLASESTVVEPPIAPELLRKYIAYAKRHVTPLITDGAKEMLITYYLRLRDLADENKPVPVTARQLEALIRLGEASARMRLSRTVEPEDAERVIMIVDACLRQVAYDAETGTLDIDKWTTGITKKKRDIIRTIRETIKALGGDDGTAKTEEVVETLVQQGFDRDEVQENLDKMIRFGEAMQPRRGIVRLI
ncbi:MAG: LAGLIDADG family homing endonuclease [Methanofollis sp.]|uniref:LAGLIDADG family homing endonuclease n=1 Tax=Methanofollis sp. TaxID=2052835 RepID=UPI002635323C|nr:LAGLIDADG family homing endonuclease [Methanofollis sp.]MDD4254275.1 LAGLIDADG family homing endonuclease [Methanofollis sp.]